MKNKVNAEGLVVSLPIKLDSVLAIEYIQEFDEHAKITVKGILHTDETIEHVYEMDMKDTIELKEKEKILFCGVPTHVQTKVAGGVVHVEIEGKSKSILLDLQKKKRSFQKKQTYKTMIEDVLGNNGILFMQKGLETKEKEQLALQYQETDWAFIKRMASHLHVPICPKIDMEKTGIYVGKQENTQIQQETAYYKVKKNIEEYVKYHATDSAVTNKEFTSLYIRSDKPYVIGDWMEHKNGKYIVSKVHMKYEDGMCHYNYKLKNEKGFQWRKKYQKDIAGCSINGEIIRVQKDQVKLHLCIDEKQPVDEALWFQVAIGYTAEGSTGLYTAMDEGENVKLFFPAADESKAYVRCVDKKDSDTSQHFSDPVTKSYGTPYGSCMQTTKDGFLISCVKDEMFIRMTESDGITLESSENIEIFTEKKMDMDCKKLAIVSQDKITFCTTGSNIIIDETMHFKTKG